MPRFSLAQAPDRVPVQDTYHSRDFPRSVALSQLEFPLNVGAGAFLASQMPTGPGSSGPVKLRLGGKEAAYDYHNADCYDRPSCGDYGYHPRKAEVAEITAKPADRKAGPRLLL